MINHASLSLRSGRHVIAAVWLTGLVATFFVVRTAAEEDYTGLALLIVLGLAGLLGFGILLNWRVGLFVFFIWFPAEDLIRKYLGNPIILYAVKDIVVIETYVSYLLARRAEKREKFKNPLAIPLALWFGWALIEVLNPAITHVLVPFAGLRMSFFYVPMLYLGYALAKDARTLRRFLITNVSVGAIVAILGIIQSVVGLEFLNPGEARHLRLELIRTASSGVEVLRPNATFVDAGRFAHYLFALFFLGVGLLGMLRGPKDHKEVEPLLKLWAWTCVLINTMALVLSGQRAVIVFLAMSALAIPSVAYFQRLKGRGRLRFPGTGVLVAIAVVGGLLLGQVLTQKPTGAALQFYEETLLPGAGRNELIDRPFRKMKGTVELFLSGDFFGQGTGTSSLGRQYIFDVDPYREGKLEGAEPGYGAVLWEWGIVGLGLWLFWSIPLLRWTFKLSARLRNTTFYWMGIGIALYAFFLLFPWFLIAQQSYQQYVAQAFLWLSVGIVFRLPYISQEFCPSVRTRSGPEFFRTQTTRLRLWM